MLLWKRFVDFVAYLGRTNHLSQLLPPGTLPKPPQIPRDLQSASPEMHEKTLEELRNSSAYSMASSYHPASHKKGSSRPDRRSSSQSPSPSHRSPPRSARRKDKEKEVQESRTPSPMQNALRDYRPYDSPTSDQEPDEVHHLVSVATDTLIQKEPGWVEFFRARAAPQRASEVLKQYQFVQKLIDKLVGKKAPFFTAHHLIQQVCVTSRARAF